MTTPPPNLYAHITSSQSGIHPNLEALTRRHAARSFCPPVPEHQLTALRTIIKFAAKFDGPLILDSGCGTGLSTINLAKAYPNHGVIGIDKSAARISRAAGKASENYILERADYFYLWPLLLKESLPFSHHFIFYPNPWPKTVHVQRRAYGHPAFVRIMELASHLEMRCNWHPYAQDMAFTLQLLGFTPQMSPYQAVEPISLFEKKYLESAAPLWVVRCDRMPQ